MTYQKRINKKIREISRGIITLNLKLLHTLNWQGIKHFKYTYINYPIQQTCNNNNFNYLTKTTIVYKNNKKNKRRAAFYEISKFDYKTRENLAKEQPPPKETLTEEDKERVVKHSSGNAWTEV